MFSLPTRATSRSVNPTVFLPDNGTFVGTSIGFNGQSLNDAFNGPSIGPSNGAFIGAWTGPSNGTSNGTSNGSLQRKPISVKSNGKL